MKTLKIRKITIGEGIPKICIPIVGKTKKSILTQAQQAYEYNCDLIEWRMDHYQDCSQLQEVLDILSDIRNVIGETVLLATFRTMREGGEKELELDAYMELYYKVIECSCVDIIDIEFYTVKENICNLHAYAHQHNVLTLVSNHDFYQTPSYDELINRLCMMKETQADIVKIAVMPQSKQDLITLLQATLAFREQDDSGPLVTMSMNDIGVLSRICGEYFGSSITFAAMEQASAPGQIPIKDLASLLKTLHHYVKNDHSNNF